LQNLDLEALDSDLFLGNPGRGEGRLFGGMVAAQSVIAAGRTVAPERKLHSLHAYFLRPGRHGVPIRFVVDRIRDGRTFTTRRVKAHQAGEAIFNLSASFARPEEGISHQDPMPEAPAPDGLTEWEDARAARTAPSK
jgi:acyl-CoA thioesterase-2